MENFKDCGHDIDSCMDVWEEFYREVYLQFFAKYFDFDNIEDKETSSKCKRWYIKLRKDLDIGVEFPKFKMAGDCIFNFNNKKNEIFKKWVENSDEGKRLLNECAEYHHSFQNFAFMPITGGMNNQKGRQVLDRPDIHANEIKKYFAGEESKIFSNSGKNRDALEWYLSIFKNDIYEYFKKVYLIEDSAFVDKFLDFAKVAVKDEVSAIKYMELALEFWNKRNIPECILHDRK